MMSPAAQDRDADAVESFPTSEANDTIPAGPISMRAPNISRVSVVVPNPDRAASESVVE
jgi:hypothetical protein